MHISKKCPNKIKILIYVISVFVAATFIEAAARIKLSKPEHEYLPYFGLSQDQINLVTWKNQSEQLEVGTITTPYAFDQVDSNLGWKVKPNAKVIHSKYGLWEINVNTNSFGLRGESPASKQKSTEDIRIGIIGASQTFGESVNDDEVYVSLLDKKFKNAEVLNFGVRGYGTDQMLLYYQSYAVQFNADIVVLAFAFHHIPRNIRSFTFFAKPYYELIDGELVLNGVPIPSTYILFDQDHPEYSKNYFNRSVFLRTLLKIYKQYEFHKQFSENSRTWAITEEIIKKFANVTRKNNAKFILVNIETDYEYLEPALENVASMHGIKYLNLGPKLRSAISSGMPLQIANDNHWSPYGHEFVAEQIYIYLCEVILKLICEE